MSIATMNWALQQRLASPQQQILLYVIADSADPTGVTTHCDPDYLVRHSRLSRATVFRRLSELRDLGLLETFNKHGARGMRIYEIRLSLSAVVHLPLKGQDDGVADGGSDDEGAESQPETQGASHAETGAVSPVRPAQSHSCDYISPPVSEESPPNPPPGGNVPAEDEPDDFKRFFVGFPGYRVMSRDRALKVWNAMNDAERTLAGAAVSHYAADLEKLKRRPKDAYKWLRDRGFDEYPFAKPQAAAAEPVWVSDPDDLAAIAVMRTICDAPPLRTIERNGKPALQRRAPVSTDLRALAQFAASDPLDWFVAEPDSTEFKAWRGRIHDWTGQWIEPRIVMLRETHLVTLVPGLPPREVQKRVKGIAVPCRWPPRKDGSIGERDAAPTAPDMTNDDLDALAKEGRR